MEVIVGKIDCQPEETGYDCSRLEVLHRHFERLINEKVICGAAYCIAHKGKVIANGSIGARSKVDSSELMQPDTVFGIASITKLFTAVAIMKLVEEGLIRLDTPVGEIVPAFAKKPFDGITLWHLLTHTSGIYPDPYCFPEEMPPAAWQIIEEMGKHFEGEGDFDWVAAGILPGLRRPVGTTWQYSSFGFCVLGEVISRVSGRFAHTYIEEEIIKPLAMKDSGFEVSPEMAIRHFIYNEEHKAWLQDVAKGIKREEEDEAPFWKKVPNTGGGLHATTYDLVRFGNAMLYGGRLEDARILGRKSVEKMTTLQLKNIPDHCWGAAVEDRLFGIGFDMRQGPAYTYSPGTFMHEGAGACSMDIDPQEELVAVWYVPFAGEEWSALPLYNTQSIIWSGII